MTFYWWSHWFWITLLGNILLPIVIVHAYPSQDIAAEYNNNNNNNNRDPKSTTTRLYQTATTIIWATTTPPNPSAVGAKIIPPTAEDTAAVDDEVDDEDEVMEELESESEEALEDGVAGGEGDRNESEEFEYKRSADIVNNANGTREQIEATIAHESPNRGSRSQDDDDDEEEKEKARNSTRQEKELHDPSVHSNYSNFSSHLASTNETRVIATSIQGSTSGGSSKSQPAEFLGHSTVEWVGSVVQAGPDASADDQADAPAAGQKAPFTLENVNKEEEIVRAENEHRSRKSKVLSAEYKHTDRFINYSTDSKNLLARSASTAPNEFDGDEGNISSEALAIQRTYFLDASAISAICFTVFGICCTVGTIGIVLYRRRYLNKPQALSEPDSSVYIDDSTMRVSDNSDEMYSLDNDSFLNSLEAMTIQNYWTDTVKHTKL